MPRTETDQARDEVAEELSAIVRAGCFTTEKEAVHEALQTMFAVKPQLRLEAAVRRYRDGEITLARAAELGGMTRWRFQEVLSQRGLRVEVEAQPVKKLDEAVDRLRKRRR